MFGLASGFYQNYLVPPEVSCLIVGLDGAGKTTLLERVKVTDFSSSPGGSSGKRIAVQKDRHISIEKMPEPAVKRSLVVSKPVEKKEHKPRRRRFSCPAPGSYNQSNFDSDEETDLVGNGHGDDALVQEEIKRDSIIELPSENVTVSPPGSPSKRTIDGIDIPDNNHSVNGNGTKNNGNGHRNEANDKEYNLKPGKKMLPQRLIRPTLGMNLGKIEACGAKVRLMDLGGTAKMRPLWERYYKDIHAITFVFDISPSCEVSKLMEARAFYRCMRDDESLLGVPIMIFANKTDTRQAIKSSVNDDNGDNTSLFIGDTSLLDIAELFLSPPRGLASESLGGSDENGNISMFAGSAKTGEGVVAAFDWLIRKGAERVREVRKVDEL